jgi:hypothetical protein
MNFDVIGVDPGMIPGLERRSHSFWYDNPWVSSDVIIKLLFHLPPAARGLEPVRGQRGFPYWRFPADYDRRVTEVIRQLRFERPGSNLDASGDAEPLSHPRSLP